jgi:hypothetical protein
VRPDVIYADMECTLINTNDKMKKARHEPNSCAFVYVCTHDSSRNVYKQFKGDTCVKDMLLELFKLSSQCIKEMQQNENMTMTKRDYEDFKNATTCHICKCAFENEKCKVRDHDHRTGEYRGASHNKCNINYFANRYVPVVFHNLRGYDGHFI